MFIYGLFSTEDNVIRYVGQTRKALKERLREHVNGALKRNGKTYKDNWIRKCYKEGFEVNIKEIEKVDSDIVDEREIF